MKNLFHPFARPAQCCALLACMLFGAPEAYGSACPPTSQDRAVTYPGRDRIIASNRLARPAGKAVYSEGQIVWLKGTLLDENCLPVSDARIELWHVNPFGRFRVASAPALATPDPTFAGTGATYSDNNGHFAFETLYPGASKNKAPFVNIRITHGEYKSFQTRLFFAGDYRNASDPTLKSMSKAQKEQRIMGVTASTKTDEDAPIEATFTLHIPGSNPWKHF